VQIRRGDGQVSLGTWAGKAQRLRAAGFLNTCDKSRSNAETLYPAHAYIFEGRS